MAGRKNKYTVDYFPHYCNRDSKTMFILENKFGLIGYAVWYKTLEILGKSEHHFIDLRNETDKLFLISKLKITEDKFLEIYDLLAKLEAIDLELWKHKIVFSGNFVSNVEDAYVRRKGINVLHKLDICKHLSIKCEQKLPKESKVKESKEDKTKVNINTEYFEILTNSESWLESVSMKHKCKVSYIKTKLVEFNNELFLRGDQKLNKNEYQSHFVSWLNKKPEIKQKYTAHENNAF